jgi:hypothetical protein
MPFGFVLSGIEGHPHKGEFYHRPAIFYANIELLKLTFARFSLISSQKFIISIHLNLASESVRHSASSLLGGIALHPHLIRLRENFTKSIEEDSF